MLRSLAAILRNGMLIICLLSLNSCVTRKACERKFPAGELREVRINTHTTTTLHDTVIVIRITGDTVYKTLPLDPPVHETVSTPVSELHTRFAVSRAWVSHGRLSHTLEQKDTLMSRRLENALRSTTTTRDQETASVKVVQVNRLTGWQTFQIRMGRLFALLIISMILIWIIRVIK